MPARTATPSYPMMRMIPSPAPIIRMEKVMVVLGDGKLMPAAEQAIYGHRAGEVFRFDFTYPH